jgi:hypothetical protein
MAESDSKGYTVNDRRASAQPETPTQAPAPEPKTGPEPPITFPTFLISLASSAVFHLGEAPHPETGQVQKNLPLAKQTIDLLAILQEKTRGNLTDEEGHLLQSLLYDLRIRFVEAARTG